jgi:hypothetical protein
MYGNIGKKSGHQRDVRLDPTYGQTSTPAIVGIQLQGGLQNVLFKTESTVLALHNLTVLQPARRSWTPRPPI